MTTTQNRCPLCGSETDSANVNDPQAIRDQIRRLEEKLRELESGPHPDRPTGGYGADEE